jgi:hypothetical protein
LIALSGVGSVAVTSQGFLVGSLVATAVVVAAAAVMLLLAPAPARSVDELEAEAVPEPVPMLEPMELGVAAPPDGRSDRPR